MSISELIALAKVRSGKSQKAMAEEMGHPRPNRLSKISAGELMANASEVIYLAEAAQMQPIKVLAEIEAERHPELAHVWKEITDKLRNLYLTTAGKVLRTRVAHPKNRTTSHPVTHLKSFCQSVYRVTSFKVQGHERRLVVR